MTFIQDSSTQATFNIVLYIEGMNSPGVLSHTKATNAIVKRDSNLLLAKRRDGFGVGTKVEIENMCLTESDFSVSISRHIRSSVHAKALHSSSSEQDGESREREDGELKPDNPELRPDKLDKLRSLT
mmetsp:Transcript_27021/g.44080  ORF Transcript_27021/g.44080 Transcript_27021/m.44080 type:complete len:127 (+) Transcript_27021:1306-1686(+)|eukprot:CAMPEP_0184645360 /NCGR_PEP_ID=MMETSP0308-20130426/1834_1 /TAXON_ID=38269 /ORGANISM="Gloeochaete witrockiana, Strain SAG 46.84" /LENGTH=126 /DNA_ID=CAMNT_0027074287 /DNA_START=1298 /DNA_END=1678 /DNA_ORIENTATION=-